MLRASLSPIISAPGLRTYFRGAFGLDSPPSGLVLEDERRRSAAGRRPGRCIGLLGSLLCQSLQKGVSVLMCPEPVDQLSVTHVRDLRAEAVPNLAHALDGIEGLCRGLSHHLGPPEEF